MFSIFNISKNFFRSILENFLNSIFQKHSENSILLKLNEKYKKYLLLLKIYDDFQKY